MEKAKKNLDMGQETVDKMMPGRAAGMLFLAGAFTLAGTSVIAARFVADSLGTFTIAAVSLFFAILGLLPVCGRRTLSAFREMLPGGWLHLILQAMFGIFLFRMFLLIGLMRTSAGEAGILTGATPAATALLARIILKEPLGRLRILGVVSTVAGVLAVQGLFASGNAFVTAHMAGNLLVLCAAICESIFNILSRISSIKAVSNESQAVDPAVQTLFVACIAFILCLGPAVAEHPASSLATLGISRWLALVWYGIVVTAIAFIFWYTGIKRCDASTAAAFSGMMPFASLILAVLLLGERPGWSQWLGGVLVVGGMLLAGRLKPLRPNRSRLFLQAATACRGPFRRRNRPDILQ